ncbi:hypothetical protein GOV12_00515 [Candidatus Pacearchaeota archaeon]|nr:hypothetical protein [Candidatus Pacearchaeota archaeon]
MSFIDNEMGRVREEIQEIQSSYPDCEVLQDEDCSLDNPTIVQIKEQDYSGNFDHAKFYDLQCSTSFLKADIYNQGEFQYSIGTCSGSWRDLLGQLEEVVETASKEGVAEWFGWFEQEGWGVDDRSIDDYLS